MNISSKVLEIIDLGFNGLEFMFGSPENFRQEVDTIIKFIESIKKILYLSIHLPLKHQYTQDRESLKLVQEVFRFGEKIDAKNYTIHPDSFDFSLKPIFGEKASFENCRKNERNLEIYRELYQRCKTKWVLDVSHALSVSENHLDDMIEWHTQESNLQQIHLSNYRGRKNHQPLFGQRQILNKISRFNVPIILEASYESLDSLVSDINYVRDFFS